MEYNFPSIMSETKKWEGGYVNHPRDPGGATNLGITQATLDAERNRNPAAGLPSDVINLTTAQAADIYRRSYWDAVQGDKLPSGLDHVAFDGAVNSGPRRGAKWLQIGVGASPDGKIGLRTLSRATALTADARGQAITKACDARRGFLRGLRTFGTFGRGWMRRVNGVEAHAHRLAGTSDDAAAAAIKRAVREERVGAAGAGAAVGGAVVHDAGDVAVQAPWFAIAIAAVVVAVFVFNQVGRSRNDRERAELILKTERSA